MKYNQMKLIINIEVCFPSIFLYVLMITLHNYSYLLSLSLSFSSYMLSLSSYTLSLSFCSYLLLLQLSGSCQMNQHTHIDYLPYMIFLFSLSFLNQSIRTSFFMNQFYNTIPSLTSTGSKQISKKWYDYYSKIIPVSKSTILAYSYVSSFSTR